MAAPPIAQVWLEVVPTVQGIQGDLTRQLVPQMTGAANTAGDKAGDAVNQSLGKKLKANLGGIMKTAMIGAVGVVAAAGIGAQLSDAIMGAGDLEQNLGASEAIFKKYSDSIVKNSESAAKNVGLSQNAYLESAVPLGAALKNAGYEGQELVDQTDKLIGRGADLASMFGGTTKDAVDAQSAALRGEFEQMEKYGVTLTAATVEQKALEMGLISAGDEMTDAAKKAATLQLIQDQTKDATGNFAKETDTFAGKLQIFKAQWDDLTVAIGEKVLPAATNFFGFLLDTALPAITDFGSKLQPLGSVLGSAFGWLAENKDLWTPFAIGLGVAAVSVGVWAAASGVAAATTAALGAALAVVTSPITLVVAGITLLVGGIILAYNKIGWFKDMVNGAFSLIGQVIGNVFNWLTATVWPAVLSALQWVGDKFAWLYNNAVKPAWDGIMSAVSNVVTWFTTSALPWVQNALNTMGNVFRWLYNNVVQPVWTGIKVVIAVVVGTLMTIWQGIVWTLRTVLGPVFNWLYKNVITPVWNGIKAVISVAWAGVKNIFSAIKWTIDNVLAPVFRWLKDNVIVPVWNGIRSAISAAWSFIRDSIFNPIKNFLRDTLGAAFTFIKDRATNAWNNIKSNLSTVWNFIRDKVFTPLKDGIRNGVVNAFEKAKTGIERVWNGIKNIVKAPVKFVLETVLQNGLIKNINSVLEKVGVKTRIPSVWPVDGFYTGGRTGGTDPREARGVVHAKEFVWDHNRTAEADRMAPGFLDDAHKHGVGAAVSKHFNPAQAAVGAGVYGGVGSFVHSLAHAIYRSGEMKVSGSAPGYDMTGAINMLDRATSVRVRRGSGGANTVNVMSGNIPAWWAGYYENNTVRLNNLVAGAMGMASKRILLAHELGHAMGLPHSARMHGGNGAQSMMNYDNMYQHNSITSADVAALSAIYGGSGKGTSPGDSGGGILDWVAEKLNPVKTFLDGLAKMLSDGLGSGLIPELVTGAVKMITGGITDWVTNKIKGSEEGAAPGIVPELFDGGGLIHRGLHVIEHNKRRPDVALPEERFNDFHRIAESIRNGTISGSGKTYTFGDVYTLDESKLISNVHNDIQKREALEFQ